MNLILEDLRIERNTWTLFAEGVFSEGIHLITGDVGSGKTTLGLNIAGLSSPASGSIIREDIRTLMISFQFPEYHVTGSTLDEECRSWGLDPEIILSAIGFIDKRFISPLNLSRGELKRLHLACVLSGSYDLLILDEPFSSLDCREKGHICEILSQRVSGITLIFTHEQAIFPRVDRLWEIIGNELVCRGKLPEALSKWQHAPSFIKKLVNAGKIPKNISPDDLEEAACRI